MNTWAPPVVTLLADKTKGEWVPITLNSKLRTADARIRMQVRGVYPNAVCQDFHWCTLVLTEPGPKGKVLDNGGVDGHRSEEYAWRIALRHIIQDRKNSDGRYDRN